MKPDGVQRGLVGEIIARFERKGFTLRGLKLFTPGKELAEEHYKDLSQKPFFKDLVNYIISGPVVAMVREQIYVCIFHAAPPGCKQSLPLLARQSIFILEASSGGTSNLTRRHCRLFYLRHWRAGHSLLAR